MNDYQRIKLNRLLKSYFDNVIYFETTGNYFDHEYMNIMMKLDGGIGGVHGIDKQNILESFKNYGITEYFTDEEIKSIIIKHTIIRYKHSLIFI